MRKQSLAYLECDNIIYRTWYDENIILEVNTNRVATLWLARVDKHNALNEEMITALNKAFDELENYLSENKTNIKVLLLRSKGKSFCAGADLTSMQKMINYDYQQNYEDALALSRVMERLHDFVSPTIAVVQGNAFGGGVGLICCCDFAIAVQQVNLCLSEVKLGIIPAVISPYLYNTMGPRNSLRYMLTAEMIESSKAFDLNIFSEVVEDDKALEQALEDILGKLLLNGPVAMQEVKSLVKQDLLKLDKSIHSQTADLIAEIRVSPEGQEGLLAFLEKRKPSWCVNTALKSEQKR